MARRFPASFEEASRGTLSLNMEYRASAYADGMPENRD
jgi:hypothetical protein